MQELLQVLQILRALCNIALLMFGFYKFLRRPSDDIKERVIAIEIKQADMERSLQKGNDRFKDQSETNEVLLHSVFALIEFEMQYCLTEKKPITSNLEKAKDALYQYMYKS